MRRLVVPACVALLIVSVVVSVVSADAADRKDPNIERLGDKSADVRAAAAQALGGG
jgi:hypothetical protein